jgi:CheY-like chemotaxis protein
VILLTAVAKHIQDTKYPLEGVLRANAEEYLEKPTKPEDLLEAVARMLG